MVYKEGQRFIKFYNGSSERGRDQDTDINFYLDKHRDEIKKCDVKVKKLNPDSELKQELNNIKVAKLRNRRKGGKPRKKTRCFKCDNCLVADCLVGLRLQTVW